MKGFIQRITGFLTRDGGIYKRIENKMVKQRKERVCKRQMKHIERQPGMWQYAWSYYLQYGRC